MKSYKIYCGDWVDQIEVDSEIFDTEMSQCVEAMTISLSNFCEINGWLEFNLDDYCIAEWIEDESSFKLGKRYVVDVEHILKNAGKIKHLKKINDNL